MIEYVVGQYKDGLTILASMFELQPDIYRIEVFGEEERIVFLEIDVEIVYSEDENIEDILKEYVLKVRESFENNEDYRQELLNAYYSFFQ